jgi:hypothetical protein
MALGGQQIRFGRLEVKENLFCFSSFELRTVSLQPYKNYSITPSSHIFSGL